MAFAHELVQSSKGANERCLVLQNCSPLQFTIVNNHWKCAHDSTSILTTNWPDFTKGAGFRIDRASQVEWVLNESGAVAQFLECGSVKHGCQLTPKFNKQTKEIREEINPRIKCDEATHYLWRLLLTSLFVCTQLHKRSLFTKAEPLNAAENHSSGICQQHCRKQQSLLIKILLPPELFRTVISRKKVKHKTITNH